MKRKNKEKIVSRKWQLRICAIMIGYLITTTTSISGLPLSYVGGTNIIQTNSILGHRLWVSHTLNRADALGVEITSIPSLDFAYTGIQYAKLLKRWNRESSQGNIYFYLSSGGGSSIRESLLKQYLVEHGLHTIGYAKGGFSGDWESRFIYVYYGIEGLFLDNIGERITNRFRFGFSPIKVPYEKDQFWIIFQLEHRTFTGVVHEATSSPRNLTIFTPYFRIFKDRYFFEIGYSDQQTFLFNMLFRL